ncbi:mediator of RNA polymerase II transcription subunit 13 isoform X2 [Pararge aegeria]|uniref:mediator of RNA polymerase II transcription subunit 13 isoform X2 n=1 Tax=Pararge aegeria TaxID=116150 RepID=UPI0019D1E1D0|nr:mediator of RNA polymerase II transcription subunit 13 isoform X2 [Pararge aegeria]
MTHQNHQTNGASLEDCHTNFFALTELYGIKWRKLVWGESHGGGPAEGEEGAAPLADPVIASYARCLAGDILCVWRRVPAAQPLELDMGMAAPPPPPLSLRASKELWIFWYGEEPDLNGLVAPELIKSQGDQGSWESGLSYECRSLLFKALHNLIERCLLSRDFVRLGKWFVQPYDGDEEDVGKSPWHLSFSFAFFLHGESTVCASVDVRQHPPVRTLTPKRLARMNEPQADRQGDNKVILAPFGLEGRATGREWSDSDAPTARLLDAWRHLYPLEQGCGAVEVECGGVRMRYPVPYVLLTEMEAPRAAAPAAALLAGRALAALCTPLPHQTAELCYSESSGDVNDDFADPTRKTPCTCAKGGCAGGGVGACSPGSCGGVSPAGAPSPHHSHAALSALTAHQVSGVPTALHTPAPTPDPLAPPTPAPPSAPPHKNYAQGESPGGGGAAGAGSPGGVAGAGAGGPQAGAAPAPALMRRPALPAPEKRLDPLEDEHSLHMLYDYTSVHAWLEHPVKRFKSSEGAFREELALGAGAATDLYAGHDHTRLPAALAHRPAPLLHIKQEKQEHDDSKEYKNLYTSDGLCPTLKDLDQIFDNSDDAASGDETLQVQTPPDSNKSLEETRCGAGGGRCVRAEELSKMFPTPPSMEAHAQPSPGFSPPDDSHTHLHHVHAHHRAHGSPPPDPIEDWSYVFKPPTIYKYVGSSKYEPLATLPSQMQPPVALPSHAQYRPSWQRKHEPATPHRTATPAIESNSNNTTNSSTNTNNGGVKRSISTSNERVNASGVASVESRPSPRRPGAGSVASPASPRAAAPACPVLLNVLLADTVLNVFRDHNFDSCTLCVCNDSGTRVVGNIRGADAATYLPGGDWGGSVDDEPSRCSCGFSAIVNRRLAHRAGLFYEDEMEITGIAEEPGGRGAAGGLADVAGLVVAQCAAVAGGAASAVARAARRAAALPGAPDHLRLNQLEYSDGGAAAERALRAAAGGIGCFGPAPPCGAVHRWPFIGARAPRSSRDVVRLMRRLRPLLQDAIQKRCCGARMWDGVTGPLTWRQFHRLAGRGNEDLCEPQPVPPLLVGHDRDWISLSPYALRHWERLSLEPYSYARDVAYVVLTSDGDALSDPVKTFFRELSTSYEACRLGRHQPIARIARDGIVRTAPSESDRDTNSEEWTGELPPGRLGEYMRAYAETLRTNLVPQLASLNVDRTLFEGSTSGMRPPVAPERPGTPGGAASGAGGAAGEHEAEAAGAWEEDESGAPALVIYVVEPPAAHAHRPRALAALLRLAAQAHTHLHHHNPLIKIISLEGVCETWSAQGGCSSEVRALAFSVFTGARRLMSHPPNGKSLTGFGTAANANLFLSAKDEKNRAPYKLFSPAWVLAPPRALKEVAETWGSTCGDQSAVLFLAYCLSHDQRWLLAAATDARGELLDTAAINIHVPARSRRKRCGPARRLGLTKLMDFALGIMSQSVQPWRLVVGRVGRIGHGELKGWSWLLSRPNLNRASNMLREICGSCSLLYRSGAPCILSACLVSTEPDSCLRLMADRFTPDERFSQASIQSHLHTPRDVTATHILVFPTSATTQSNQMPFEPPNANGEENDILMGLEMPDEEMGEENMTDLLDEMFMWPPRSPHASPRRHDDDASREGSPARAHLAGAYSRDDDHQPENVGTVLQQPLALGYLVSTAPLGTMPSWWWASCRHLRDACPAFLKNALHLQCAAQDDYTTSLSQRRDHNAHPLDSTTTTDVLRYVLEGYNALSWLALDGTTHDRLSCLPLHVQVLMQLYHTAAALG